MSNRRDIQFTYNPHNKLTLLDCSFVVSANNANGTGISGLNQGGRIQSVFMAAGTVAATTATSVFASGVSTITLSSVAGLVPGMVITDSTTGGNITGGTKIVSISPVNSTIVLSAVTAGASAVSPGDTLSFAMTAALAGNPNPAAGLIVVNLQDNYNALLGIDSSFQGAVTGSAISISGTTVLTIGNAYQIVTLGTSTQANWVSAGVAANVTAAPGVSFISAITGAGTGTGTVKAVAPSGIDHIELIGSANLMNSNGAIVLGSGNGMQLILACYKNAVLTAPTAGTTISLAFSLNNSAQGV